MDTDVVAMIKHSKNLQRLLANARLNDWRKQRELLAIKPSPEAPESARLLTDQQQRQLDLMGWSERTFNSYEDIIKRDIDEMSSSKDARKNKQLTNTDAYQLVFEERRESLKEEPSRLAVPPAPSCKDQLVRVISYFDAFKVQPRFRSNGLLGKEKSPFVGCLCIVAFILAVLLLFTAFGYFATTQYRISLEA